MKQADIGLIGLAVMGENLIMNMESKGFTVAVFNRTVEKVDAFVNGRAKGKNIIGAHTMQEFVASLAKPRKVFMMVKAGAAVDGMIDQLIPLRIRIQIMDLLRIVHRAEAVRPGADDFSKGRALG